MAISLGPSLTKIIDAKSTATGTGTSAPLRLHGADEVVFYFQSTGTTSGGTIQFEEAYYDPNGLIYAGTWSALATAVSASSFTGGAQLVTHVINYSVWALRVRIATQITGGGSVSCWAWGN